MLSLPEIVASKKDQLGSGRCKSWSKSHTCNRYLYGNHNEGQSPTESKKKIIIHTYNLIQTSQGFILNITVLTDLQHHNNSHYFCRNRAQMPRRTRIRSPVQLPQRPAWSPQRCSGSSLRHCCHFHSKSQYKLSHSSRWCILASYKKLIAYIIC